MMRRKVMTALLAAAMAVSVCACGAKNEANSENGGAQSESSQQSEAAEPVEKTIHYDGPSSTSFDIDYDQYVKSLADYSAITVQIASTYEITEQNRENVVAALISQYGGDATVEVTDHDTIQDGDLVKLDYTGYLNDEAFQGGSAENQIIDVTANASMDGSGFIPGFTDALKGAKVGETVKGEVTFPDNYGNADLAGQKTVFEFVIHSIVKPITISELTDQIVGNLFASEGIGTVDAFLQAVDRICENNLKQQKATQIQNYLIENSDIEIPEDYLNAVVYEYAMNYEEQYCAGSNLETTLTAYGVTVDDFLADYREAATKGLKADFALNAICKKEGISMDDEFSGYLDYMISSYGVADAKTLYEGLGNGSEEEGKKYVENNYLLNKTIDKLAENTKVVFE